MELKATIDTGIWRLERTLCHNKVTSNIRDKFGTVGDITKGIKALILNEIDNGRRNYDYSRTVDI